MPRDIRVQLGDNTLQRGCVIKNDEVKGRVYGNENGPAIVILGGISASRFVADGGRLDRGWWSTLVRPGGPIDLNKYKVIGLDFAPSTESESRPKSITTHDQAARLKELLLLNKISNVSAIIGSSYGGMTALAFAHDFPNMVNNICIIGATHKPYPIGVAWRGIQRRAVLLGLEAGNPAKGMKLARELAMTTYRTAEEFDNRFNLREIQKFPSKFDICEYLGSRGDAFADLMDAERFLALSESIDLHNIEPELITTPTLLMSATSDQLSPLANVRELRDRLGGVSELFTFTSLYGHDAFLKEYDAMAPRLLQFCQSLDF